jgi:hypothetical protein
MLQPFPTDSVPQKGQAFHSGSSFLPHFTHNLSRTIAALQKGQTFHTASTGFPQAAHTSPLAAAGVLTRTGTTACGFVSTFAPHPPQNFAPFLNGVPHIAHIFPAGISVLDTTASGAVHPQEGQNFALSFMCVPQLPQNIIHLLLKSNN